MYLLFIALFGALLYFTLSSVHTAYIESEDNKKKEPTDTIKKKYDIYTPYEETQIKQKESKSENIKYYNKYEILDLIRRK